MMHENDKLLIPEEYRKMSVSKLRREKEKIYTNMQKNSNLVIRKPECKKEGIVFHF